MILSTGYHLFIFGDMGRCVGGVFMLGVDSRVRAQRVTTTKQSGETSGEGLHDAGARIHSFGRYCFGGVEPFMLVIRRQ